MVNLTITRDKRDNIHTLRPSVTHSSRVLLTGVTGMIGGEIAKEFDAFGVKNLWCLVRTKEAQTPDKRLASRIKKSSFNASNIEALRGDVTQKNLGLEEKNHEMLTKEVDIIVHCAAETSFIQGDSCERVNIEGTKNIIQFAKSCRNPPLIVFVSTACNGGKNKNACLSEDSGCRPDRSHHNGYTLSKAQSESLVRESGLPFLVVRPTIVISAGVMDQVFARQILWFAPLVNEFTHLPLDPDSRVDVTPVRFVAENILALARKPTRSYDTYHLSAGTNHFTRVRDIFRVIADIYERPEINYIAPQDWTPEVRRKYVKTTDQRKYYHALRYYFPFLNADVVYDNQRLVEEVGPLEIPTIDRYFPEVVKQISWDDAVAGSESP